MKHEQRKKHANDLSRCSWFRCLFVICSVTYLFMFGGIWKNRRHTVMVCTVVEWIIELSHNLWWMIIGRLDHVSNQFAIHAHCHLSWAMRTLAVCNNRLSGSCAQPVRDTRWLPSVISNAHHSIVYEKLLQENLKLRAFCITPRFYITQRFRGINRLINWINRLISCINRWMNGLTRLMAGGLARAQWPPQGRVAGPPSH